MTEPDFDAAEDAPGRAHGTERHEQGHGQDYLSLIAEILGDDEVERRKAQATLYPIGPKG